MIIKYLYKLYNKLFYNRALREFAEKFPGKCPICSLHYVMVNQGHSSGRLTHHKCPESYARWKENSSFYPTERRFLEDRRKYDKVCLDNPDRFLSDFGIYHYNRRMGGDRRKS